MSKIDNIDSEKESNFQSLKLGCEGSMVFIVQKMFNSIGYDLVENAIFNDNMEQIVREFQSKRDALTVDGIVGYKTMIEIDTLFELHQER